MVALCGIYTAMQFTSFLLPKSFKWTLFCEDVKSKQCPHCGKIHTLKSHGSLYGVDPVKPEKSRRALRFYCSNRYSNKGCGQTFSVYFKSIIPYHTVRSSHLSDFFRLLLQGCTVHMAWYSSLIPFSLRSASSWLIKLKLNLSSLRSKLHELMKNISPTHLSPEMETLNMLKEHFSQDDFIASAQNNFQLPILQIRKFSS